MGTAAREMLEILVAKSAEHALHRQRFQVRMYFFPVAMVTKLGDKHRVVDKHHHQLGKKYRYSFAISIIYLVRDKTD
jgi:hypothetical protein